MTEQLAAIATGTADYVRKGHIETAHNRGDEYRAVLVELKRR